MRRESVCLELQVNNDGHCRIKPLRIRRASSSYRPQASLGPRSKMQPGRSEVGEILSTIFPMAKEGSRRAHWGIKRVTVMFWFWF